MDPGQVIGDGLVAAATLGAAVIAALGARSAKQAHQVGEANARKLEQVSRQTNGLMDQRIREAVRDELIKHSENTEAIRDLLDGLIMGVQATAEEESHG